MPTIRIQGTDLPYDESDIFTFKEGLIGLPHLRRMVLVRQLDIFPFLWLASLDDSEIAFLVIDARTLYPDYRPAIADDVRARISLDSEATPLALAIVTIAQDWTRSTVNLRAPLFVNTAAMSGAQAALVSTAYKLDEPLPLSSETTEPVTAVAQESGLQTHSSAYAFAP
jgi:flagellar assembly factor FliW